MMVVGFVTMPQNTESEAFPQLGPGLLIFIGGFVGVWAGLIRHSGHLKRFQAEQEQVRLARKLDGSLPHEEMTLAELEEVDPAHARCLLEAALPEDVTTTRGPARDPRQLLRHVPLYGALGLVLFGFYRCNYNMHDKEPRPLAAVRDVGFQESRGGTREAEPPPLPSLVDLIPRVVAAADSGGLPPAVPNGQPHLMEFPPAWGAHPAEWKGKIRWWRSGDRQIGVLIEPGPDGEMDLIPTLLEGVTTTWGLHEKLLPWKYDPTNGIASAGDRLQILAAPVR